MRWLRRKQREHDLEREICADLELEAAEQRAAGLSPEQARHAARRAFGNPALVKEDVRATWGGNFAAQLAQDLRYAVRTLRKSPAFSAVAILSLALGIGANSAIFTLIDAVMLRSLPVAAPQQLVQVDQYYDNRKGGFSYPLYTYLRDHNHSFSGLLTISNTLLHLSDEPQAEVTGRYISGNFFQVLGVRPLLGRATVPDDDRVSAGGGNPVAVISYGLWQRRFGGDPGALGKTLPVEDQLFTVVGVLPPEFFGLQTGETLDFVIPIANEVKIRQRSWLANEFTGWLSVAGRLQRGVSPATARADLNVILRQVNQAEAGLLRNPHERELFLTRHLELTPAASGLSALRDRFSRPLLVLMAVVSLVLLIACANVANLLLGRSAARRREMAVRLALGAGRGRLVRQLLTESLLLSALGGLLALLLAQWGSALLVTMMANGKAPLRLDLHPDARVLAFLAAMCILTAVLFGIAAAYRSTRVDAGPALKQGAHSPGASSRTWFGKALVMAQVALSLVLLMGAGLFLGTLRNLHTMDAGFARGGILLASVAPGAAGFKGPRLAAFYQDLLQRLDALPGVHASSLSLITPIAGGGVDLTAMVEGYTPQPHEDTSVYVNRVSPGYFTTFGTRLLAGRDFDWHDRADSPPVVIVNQTMARYYFHDASPLGRWVALADGPPAKIVGVVADARYMSLREPLHRTAYVNAFQEPEMDGSLSLEVRTAGDPLQLLPTIRAGLRALAANVALKNESTFEGQIDRSLLEERLMATLSGFFGALALLLAAIGLYGVLAYAVGRRTAEIGIRMALGADRRNVLWMVLRETVGLVLTGIAIGLPLTFAATRLVEKLLFGLTPADPLTMALAILTMLAAAAAAGYWPARRATRVDPLVALRYE